MDGPGITAWTIRIAMILFVSVLGLRISEAWLAPKQRTKRIIWTLGCLLFLTHIAAGMHFYHGWNHTHAYDATAEQTHETIGVRFGGGIYVNHAMAIVWVLDVLWSWITPKSYIGRSPGWNYVIVGFFLFIAVNGFVIFKSGLLRWSGLLVLTLLLIAWCISFAGTRRSTAEPSS